MTDTTAPAAEEQAPTLTPELQAEVFKLIRLAIADPAAFVPRNKAGDGETVPNWSARAVVAALECHPIVAIRPDRPTQWAYDQACKALEKHRQRADKAETAAEALRYERRLLGFARMTLDLVAAGGPDRWEQARREAEDVAQRIVDEIGHPVTDEPALGPGFRAEIAQLAVERDRAKGIAEGLHKELRDEVAARGQAERERDAHHEFLSAEVTAARAQVEHLSAEVRRLTTERDQLRQQLEAESVAYYLLRDERDEARAALDRVRELREHYRSSDDVVDGDLRAAEVDTAIDGSGTSDTPKHQLHDCHDGTCRLCWGAGPVCVECGDSRHCPVLDGGGT